MFLSAMESVEKHSKDLGYQNIILADSSFNLKQVARDSIYSIFEGEPSL